jgi:hypothetical protein
MPADFEHLDEVLGRYPLAVNLFVETLGVTGQGCDDLAGVKAHCRDLEAGDDPELGCPACRSIAGFSEASRFSAPCSSTRILTTIRRDPPSKTLPPQ